MIARNNMNKNNAFRVYSINGEEKGTPWDEIVTNFRGGDMILSGHTVLQSFYAHGLTFPHWPTKDTNISIQVFI